MTNKKHNYDWDLMDFHPDEDRINRAFLWDGTPQGFDWWADNEFNPECQAEFARMKRLYAEDMAAKEGPVRTVTRKEIVTGLYGRVGVERVTRPYVRLHFTGDSMLNSDELTDAIETLTQIRDALEDGA